MTNVLVYVDFWNFQLNWNNNMPPEEGVAHVRIDWDNLPKILMAELPSVAEVTEGLIYKGVHVYASVSPSTGQDSRLKNFLHNVLGQKRGFSVNVKKRRNKTDHCPHCNQSIQRTIEKGVDTSIATDLLVGAVNNSYDVAYLLSADADHIPAIQAVQNQLGKRIVFAGFKKGSNNIRTACWSHVLLDGDISERIKSG